MRYRNEGIDQFLHPIKLHRDVMAMLEIKSQEIDKAWHLERDRIENEYQNAPTLKVDPESLTFHDRGVLVEYLSVRQRLAELENRLKGMAIEYTYSGEFKHVETSEDKKVRCDRRNDEMTTARKHSDDRWVKLKAVALELFNERVQVIRQSISPTLRDKLDEV